MPENHPRKNRLFRRADPAMGEQHSQQRFLSVAEAAEFLNVPQDTVRRWLFQRRFRSFRAGRTVRILLADLEGFLQERPAVR